MIIVEIPRHGLPTIYEAKSFSDAVKWHDYLNKTSISDWWRDQGHQEIFKLFFTDTNRKYIGFDRRILDDHRKSYLLRRHETGLFVEILDGINELRAYDWPIELREVMDKAVKCFESFQKSDTDEEGEKSEPIRGW